MKHSRNRGEAVNIDVLSLSLMCCLLASVVGLLVLNGVEKHEPRDEAPPPPPVSADSHLQTDDSGGAASSNPKAKDNAPSKAPVLTDLRVQTDHLYATVQEVEQSRKEIVSKVGYSMLERDNRALEARAMELQAKLALVQRIQVAKDETARLAKEWADKHQSAKSAITPQAKQMLGEYKGPYVLIECVENGAVIYPGNKRIEMKPSKETTDKLLDQITQAGFVAFVVRPSGWYNNSYDQLRPLIYQRLAATERQSGKFIGRSVFPLGAADSIDDYLPPEVKP